MGSDLGRSNKELTVDEILERIHWLLEDGEADKARVLSRRATKSYPEDPRVWMASGDALSECGRPRDALRSFDKAMELDPSWIMVKAKLAETMLEVGRTQDAERVIGQALAQDRDEPHATFVQAMVWEFLGRDDVADFWYRRAAKLDSDSYFRPVRPSKDGFGAAVSEAVELLPELARAMVEAADLRVRDLPSRTTAGETSMLRMCDTLAGDGDGLERVYLYRCNLERVCRDIPELVEQVFFSLLNELKNHPKWEHLLDEA